MKDFLKMLLIEPFTDDDWLGFWLGIVMWIIMLMITGVILLGICQAANRIGRQDQVGNGIVVEKDFIPAHREHHGKAGSHWVEDAWLIYIEKDNLSDYIYVSHCYYNHIQVGDTVCIDYYTGRLWKSFYIISIN